MDLTSQQRVETKTEQVGRRYLNLLLKIFTYLHPVNYITTSKTRRFTYGIRHLTGALTFSSKKVVHLKVVFTFNADFTEE